MVELNILNKRYWGKRALENISLRLPRGEIVGLFGENGLRYILKNLLSTSLRSGIGIRI